jgi:maleate isomerase
MDPTIPLAPVRAFAAPPYIDDAAEMLAAAPLAAVGIAFTSSGYVLGGAEEVATAARLEERTGGLPVVPTCASAIQALRSLEIERMMLVNPPWFDSELDALGAAFFRDQGFAVVSSGPAVLPSAQTRIDPAALHAYIRERIPDEAQAVFVGGNGFRAVGVIEALERDLRRPVLTANQVLLWGMLGRSRTRRRVAGYGRLFSQRAD